MSSQRRRDYSSSPPPAGHPEFRLKPVRIYFLATGVQFSFGPGDYAEPDALKQHATGITVHIGQIKEGDLQGIATTVPWGEPVQNKFRLHKL